MSVQTRNCEGFSTCLGTFLKAIAVAIIILAVVPPAFATFPGSNGRIAYTVSSGLSNTGNPLASIVFTDLGKLTLAPAGVSESYPAWSPDGSQLAFVRQDTSTSRFTIEIIRRDGTGNARSLAPKCSALEIVETCYSPPGPRMATLSPL
jgi:WD40 repeat protein